MALRRWRKEIDVNFEHLYDICKNAGIVRKSDSENLENMVIDHRIQRGARKKSVSTIPSAVP